MLKAASLLLPLALATTGEPEAFPRFEEALSLPFEGGFLQGSWPHQAWQYAHGQSLVLEPDSALCNPCSHPKPEPVPPSIPAFSQTVTVPKRGWVTAQAIENIIRENAH